MCPNSLLDLQYLFVWILHVNAFHLVALGKQGLWFAWKWTAGQVVLEHGRWGVRQVKQTWWWMSERGRRSRVHIMEVTVDSAPFCPACIGAKPPGGRNYCHTADSSPKKKQVCNGGMAQHLLSVCVFSYTKYHIARKGRGVAIFQACEHAMQASQWTVEVLVHAAGLYSDPWRYTTVNCHVDIGNCFNFKNEHNSTDSNAFQNISALLDQTADPSC